MEEKLQLFLESVEESRRDLVAGIDDFLTQNRCGREIKTAKSGYVVTWNRPDTKKALANLVFRKTGIKLRIYPDHLAQYETFLDSLPEKMKKEIRRASVCKRLIDPSDCNPRCVMGYDFSMDGEHFQKCRYMAFMPTLNEESIPYIRQFLEKELSAVSIG